MRDRLSATAASGTPGPEPEGLRASASDSGGSEPWEGDPWQGRRSAGASGLRR